MKYELHPHRRGYVSSLLLRTSALSNPYNDSSPATGFLYIYNKKTYTDQGVEACFRI
jgi:hypothetical protein